MHSEGAISVIRSVETIWLDREQSQIESFLSEKTYFTLCMRNILWVTIWYNYYATFRYGFLTSDKKIYFCTHYSLYKVYCIYKWKHHHLCMMYGQKLSFGSGFSLNGSERINIQSISIFDVIICCFKIFKILLLWSIKSYFKSLTDSRGILYRIQA